MIKDLKQNSAHIGRIFIIALIIALAALNLVQKPGSATYMQIAGLLCFGWVHFFVKGPDGAKTLGDVYRAASKGWRMPPSAKALTVLGVVLMSIGLYLEGR